MNFFPLLHAIVGLISFLIIRYYLKEKDLMFSRKKGVVDNQGYFLLVLVSVLLPFSGTELLISMFHVRASAPALLYVPGLSMYFLSLYWLKQHMKSIGYRFKINLV